MSFITRQFQYLLIFFFLPLSLYSLAPLSYSNHKFFTLESEKRLLNDWIRFYAPEYNWIWCRPGSKELKGSSFLIKGKRILVSDNIPKENMVELLLKLNSHEKNHSGLSLLDSRSLVFQKLLAYFFENGVQKWDPFLAVKSNSENKLRLSEWQEIFHKTEKGLIPHLTVKKAERLFLLFFLNQVTSLAGKRASFGYMPDIPAPVYSCHDLVLFAFNKLISIGYTAYPIRILERNDGLPPESHTAILIQKKDGSFLLMDFTMPMATVPLNRLSLNNESIAKLAGLKEGFKKKPNQIVEINFFPDPKQGVPFGNFPYRTHPRFLILPPLIHHLQIEYLNRFAQFYLHRNEEELALTAEILANSQDQKDPYILNNLGQVYLYFGKRNLNLSFLHQALRHFELAKKILPGAKVIKQHFDETSALIRILEQKKDTVSIWRLFSQRETHVSMSS